MAQRSDTDVIAILTHDHREVEDLFQELERLPRGEHDRRRELTDQAIIELVRHSVAEEEYLYPAARQYVPDGGSMVDEEISEHAEAEKTMKELENIDSGKEQFRAYLSQLMEEIRHHVDEEENELFARLTEHTDQETLEDLGSKVSDAKGKAPTRPHPSRPTGEKPELLRAVAPGAGLVDRARDYLSGR